MKARLWSTFNVIGVVLIVLGIVGLCLHNFVYDPGQISDGHEPWYYIGVGLLLIVNGLVTSPDEEKADDAKKAKGQSAAKEPARPQERSTNDARRAVGARTSVMAAAKEQPEQTKP